MYFFSINTIKGIKAYRDTANGVNYIEFKFTDLDNVNHTILYGNKDQYPDTDSGETMNEFTSNFIAVLDLCYDLFDYDDLRNDLFKILYRTHLEYNRRSYFRATLVDGNYKAYLSTNLDRFEKFRWFATKMDKITKIKTTDETFYGYDSDGNLIELDSTKVILLAYYVFDFTDIIFDNSKIFVTTTIELEQTRQFIDFNAIIDTPQVYLYLTDITSDIIDTVISKSSLHSDQITNIIIDKPVSDLTDEIRNKIKSELSNLNNTRIYLLVDSEDMTKERDTVINEIDEIYDIFGNYIDGIYLKNIKSIDLENATIEDRENYDNYYMTIKNHAHHSINSNDGTSMRYYIIGRMTDGDVVPSYIYGKYNNPVDQIIQYINVVPTQASQLGDITYKNNKIAIIKDKDLTELSEDQQKEFIDNITKYCTGFYITDQDNFDTLSNSLEDQQKYCEPYVDNYKSFYFTKLS